MKEMRSADVAARDSVSRLLNQRVPPVIERNGVNDAAACCLVEKLLRFRRRHSEWFIGYDMFAPGDRGRDDRIMQEIWSGVMDDLHVRVLDQRFERTVCLACSQRFSFGSR